MDIALELCDTYFFDYAYSYILPAQPAPYLMQNGFGNSTVEALKVASSWQYTPASKYLSFTPRDAAWMSQLPRDNAYRQFFSLFLIMWYVPFPNYALQSWLTIPGSPAPSSTSLSQPSPTSSSSTRPPSSTRNSSRTKSRWRSRKP